MKEGKGDFGCESHSCMDGGKHPDHDMDTSRHMEDHERHAPVPRGKGKMHAQRNPDHGPHGGPFK